jgi:hypothetical protein
MILDVGSLTFQGHHPMFPAFGDAGCADACARTPGCNAWTFCDSREGCGSSCKAYTEQNPRRKLATSVLARQGLQDRLVVMQDCMAQQHCQHKI